MSDAEAAAARLWLDAMHAIGRPLAHEVKNALNGVSVNLEVVRTRAARSGAQGGDVVRFAEAAAEQLGALTAMADGLLAMVRPAPAAGELGPVVERLGALLDVIARPDGGEVCVEAGIDPVATALPGDRLRAIVAALLVQAFDRTRRLSCEVTGGDAPALRLTRPGSGMPLLGDDVRAAAAAAGVRLDLEPEAWTATFPACTASTADTHSPGATHA